MRTGLFATIGAIWLAGTGASVAAPINAAAIGEAAEQLSVTESVHCRSFRHWHRWGYSRGCIASTSTKACGFAPGSEFMNATAFGRGSAFATAFAAIPAPA